MVWKEVVGFEGYYEVSDTGLVRSIRRYIYSGRGYRWIDGKFLKLRINQYGYHQVNLKKLGKSYCKRVHRMVLEAFVANTESKPVCNHIDGDKLNNNIDNLEWSTVRENTIHAYANGLAKGPIGEKNRGSKLTEKQVIKLRNDYTVYGEDIATIASRYGVKASTVNKIIKRESWRHI